MDAIDRELADLVRNGPSEAELERAKRLSISQNKMAMESTSSEVAWAGESLPELDRKIRLQEAKCQTAWLAAISERSEYVAMYDDWSTGWPRMHSWKGYHRLVEKQHTKAYRAECTWLKETAQLVAMYDAHRALTRAKP